MPLKLVNQFIYRDSNISSTESAINIHIGKAWTVIDRLSTIWKSDLSDEIKRKYFQAVTLSVLLFGCTSWSLTKCLEKSLIGTHKDAVFNKSWEQQPTKQPLKASKTCRKLLEKYKRTHKWRSPMNSNTWTRQLCVDTLIKSDDW